jgi:hypothetical protein
MHLERHDRLTDHLEQPRRQRDQLRRELRVRRTGSDRRLPVSREQHRHQQLQPLYRNMRSNRACVLEPTRGTARSANGGRALLETCCPACVPPVAVCP